MGKTRKQYTEEFRRLAVERMMSCPNAVSVAKDLGVHRNLLYKWQKYLEGPSEPAEVLLPPVT